MTERRSHDSGPAATPRAAGDAASPAPALLAAAQAAQILPLPDDSGLGLLHFGVVPSIPLAGAVQTVTLPAAAQRPAVDLSTIAELLGVQVSASWQALFPRGYAAGGAPAGAPSPVARGVPGTLLPVAAGASAGGIGGPADPLQGLTQRFLPLPPLTARPGTWSARLRVSVTARAQPPEAPLPAERPGAVTMPLSGTFPLAGDITNGRVGPLLMDVATVDPATRDPAGVTVGPVEIPLLLPTLPVPPLLVLFGGRNFQLPALAVCPVPGVAGSVTALLDALAAVVSRVDAIRGLLARQDLPLPEPYAKVADQLQLVVRLLGGPGVRLLTSAQEPDLNAIDLMLRILDDREAEDGVRSLVYFGLPGTTVELWPGRNFTARDDPQRFLRLGVTDAMAAQGRFLVQLSDLNRREVPGVLHAADLERALPWRDPSSFRFALPPAPAGRPKPG